MANNCASGRGGSVLVGTATYNFKNWSLSMEEKLNESTNFSTSGYRVWCRGLDSATISVEGPYDIGSGTGAAMALAMGTSYSVTLTVASGLTYVLTAICNKADLSQDVDGLAMLKASFQVNGSFTASIT